MYSFSFLKILKMCKLFSSSSSKLLLCKLLLLLLLLMHTLKYVTKIIQLLCDKKSFDRTFYKAILNIFI